MQIRAAVIRDPAAPFSIETLELDEPRSDEVIVRIVGVGVCHTDIAARDQILPVPLPVVLGHEGAGIVEQVGSDVAELGVGDHVVLSFASCGECGNCEAHVPGYCESFMPLNFGGVRGDGSQALSADGVPVGSHYFGQSSFASHALVNQRNAIRVRDDAPLEMLGPLGCGVMTGAGSIIQALACEAGSTLLILGGGSVGLSAVLGGVVQECTSIIVSEPMHSRRSLAQELGAAHTIDPTQVEDFAAEVRAICPQGVDFILDTSGKASVINAAIPSLTHRGTIGLLAVPASMEDAILPVNVIDLLGLGYKIKGITEGDVDPASFIPRMLDLHANGKFPFEKLVTTYPLSEINRAVTEQHEGLSIKPVLIP